MKRNALVIAFACLPFVSAVCLILAPCPCSGQQASPDSLAPDSLTQELAVHLTLSNHPAVVQAQQAIAAAEARLGTNRSSYYPDISLSGTYARIGPVPTIDIPHQPAMKLYPQDNYDVHLGLRQTLYDFGRTATSVQLALSGRKSAADQSEQVSFDLAYRTIAVFNSILILRQSVTVLDEQIEALNQHLDSSRKKVQAGTATDFDVLTTEVRIAATRNERIDTADALEIQEILFRQLTGLASTQPVQLRGGFSRPALSLDSDSLMEAAFRERPEMIVSRDAEISAAIRFNLSALGNKPSLALSMTSGFKNGYVPDLNDLEANFSAGVQVQFPLFDGHRTRHQKYEAEANLRSARAYTEGVRRQISSDVQQAITGAEASLEKIENAEVQLRQAEEAVSIARTKYEAGVVTNLDLLDTQTALTQAKLNHLRALYSYTMSLVAVDNATGRKVW